MSKDVLRVILRADLKGDRPPSAAVEGITGVAVPGVEGGRKSWVDRSIALACALVHTRAPTFVEQCSLSFYFPKST